MCRHMVCSLPCREGCKDADPSRQWASPCLHCGEDRQGLHLICTGVPAAFSRVAYGEGGQRIGVYWCSSQHVSPSRSERLGTRVFRQSSTNALHTPRRENCFYSFLKFILFGQTRAAWPCRAGPAVPKGRKKTCLQLWVPVK